MQDSLGGNAVTRVIATVSACHAEETSNTLEFAGTARRIETVPNEQR